METKNSTPKLSSILTMLMVALAGFAVGLNIGSQLFTERPDFITAIILGIVMLGCIIIPFAKKKEKEKDNKGETI